MKFNKALLALLLVVLFSCEKESVQEEKDTDVLEQLNDAIGTDGQVVYYVDTEDNKKICNNVYTKIVIQQNINSDTFNFQLTALSDFDSKESVQLTVLYDFEFEAKDYNFLNYSDYINSKTFSYIENTHTVYNNTACDSILRDSNEHYGQVGELKITSINTSDKTITGTFSMDLCKGENENVMVWGEFKNFKYTKN